MDLLKNGNINSWHWLLVVFILGQGMVNSVYADEGLAAKEEALRLISDVADRICKDIPLEGKKENLELSGSAKAEINGLIKKLVDLGIEGAAKYEKSDYEGVLQEDLVKALETSTNCRLEVFRELKDDLLK